MTKTKTDLYDILGVSKDANDSEIKKAYRKLALQYHPDKNKDRKEEAEESFKKVTQAYSILSDEKKRKHYDLTGSIDESGDADMNFNMNMDDIFKSMFGGEADIFENLAGLGGLGGLGNMGTGGATFMFSGGNGGFTSFSSSMKGMQQSRPQTIYVDVTLDEVFNGTQKNIELTIDDLCTHCQGTGADKSSDVIKCITCNGKGSIHQKLGPFLAESVCPSCNGQGTTIKNKNYCHVCHGKKTIQKKKNIEIKIPKGIPNKSRQILKNEGSYDKNIRKHNDIIIAYQYIIPKDTSIDKNGNIFMTLNISLEQLLCGFYKEIDIYKKHIIVHTSKYVDPSKKIIIEKMGLPQMTNKGKENGNIILSLNVIYPNDTHKLHKYHDVFLKIFKKNEEKEKHDKEIEKFKTDKSILRVIHL